MTKRHSPFVVYAHLLRGSFSLSSLCVCIPAYCVYRRGYCNVYDIISAAIRTSLFAAAFGYCNYLLSVRPDLTKVFTAHNNSTHTLQCKELLLSHLPQKKHHREYKENRPITQHPPQMGNDIDKITCK